MNEVFNELDEFFKIYKISVGIGLHIGNILEVDIGSKNIKDFTIIGSNVNLCSRLCAAANDKEILCSYEFFEHLHNKSNFRLKGKARIKGFTKLIPVYSNQL